MQKLTDLSEAASPGTSTVTRRDALIFRATGRTASGLRASGADPFALAEIAALAGVSQRVMRKTMTALADGIDAIAAEGLSPEECAAELREQHGVELPADGAR